MPWTSKYISQKTTDVIIYTYSNHSYSMLVKEAAGDIKVIGYAIYRLALTNMALTLYHNCK